MSRKYTDEFVMLNAVTEATTSSAIDVSLVESWNIVTTVSGAGVANEVTVSVTGSIDGTNYVELASNVRATAASFNPVSKSLTPYKFLKAATASHGATITVSVDLRTQS